MAMTWCFGSGSYSIDVEVTKRNIDGTDGSSTVKLLIDVESTETLQVPMKMCVSTHNLDTLQILIGTWRV